MNKYAPISTKFFEILWWTSVLFEPMMYARIIAGNKHLSKNILDADLTIYIVSKYLCVDMTICDSQKYFVLI